MGLIVRQAGLLISLMVLRSWTREKESEDGGWGEGVGSMCRAWAGEKLAWRQKKPQIVLNSGTADEQVDAQKGLLCVQLRS